MSQEQISLIQQDIVVIKEKLSHALKRIDKSEGMNTHIHQLATNIEGLTIQVKHQNERMEEMIHTLDARMNSHSQRINTLEKEPGRRWNQLISQTISLMAAALAGGIIAYFLG